MGESLDLADAVHWAVDISGTFSALLLALLAAHGQRACPGATREEVISAILLGLPAAGNAVTACLPAALSAYDA